MLGRGTINDLAISPDGSILATGGSAGIWLYELPDLEPIALLQGHTDDVTSIAFSPDGEMLISSGDWLDSTVRLWDVNNHSEITTLIDQVDSMYAVAFSPDGKTIAASIYKDEENTIRFWDVNTLAETAAITREGYVSALAFSPDGGTLASAEFTDDSQSIIFLWDVETRTEIAAMTGHYDLINMLAFSPEGQMLASAGRDGGFRLWDINTHAEIPGSRENFMAVSSLAFSPDGQTLVVGDAYPDGANLGSEGMLEWWDVATQTPITAYGAHPTHPTGLAFTPDGQTLVSASEEGILKFWDVETQTELAVMDQEVSGNLSAAFSPDGLTFATASDYKIVSLWETETATQIKTFYDESTGYGEFRPGTSSVMFSPDGSLLVTSSIGIRLWEVETGTLRGEYGAGWAWTSTPTRFAEDGQSITVTDYLGMGGITYTSSLDVQTLQPIEGLRTTDEPNCDCRPLAISDDGRFDAFIAGDGGRMTDDGTFKTPIEVSEFNPETGNRHITTVLFVPEGRVQLMVFPANSQLFVAADADHTIHLWETETFSEIATLSGHIAPVTRLIFSRDYQLLASTDEDGVIRVWDLNAGSEISTITMPDIQISNVAFSPDGETLVVSDVMGEGNNPTDQVGTVRLWDVPNGTEIATLDGNYSGQLLFSPDGETLATTEPSGIVHLWDMNTNTEIATLTGHAGGLRQIMFSPDSRTLLTVGYDSTIRVWRQGE